MTEAFVMLNLITDNLPSSLCVMTNAKVTLARLGQLH